MEKRKRVRISIIALVMLLTALLCRPLSVMAVEEVNLESYPNVLFISSYSCTWPTVMLQFEGIRSVLDDVVDAEFMDTKIVSQEVAEQQLAERIRYKQEMMGRYEAVIVGDDAALLFAMAHREELFAGVPIVFEGINNIEYAEEVSKDPLISGVVEQFSYQENLDFALRIQPDANRVVAIVDNTVTGIGEQQQFLAQQENYPRLTFEMLNGSELTKEQLIEEISKIDEKTILLYLILSEDVEGKLYSNTQICHLIRDYAQVPVLRFVQAGIGEGVLGGNIVSHRDSGAIAARMVLQMLNSSDPSRIEMRRKSPNGFVLDQKVLDRFEIPKALIPKDAEIINRKIGVWEAYGKVILPTLVISVCMMVVAVMAMRAFYEQRRRMELEKKNEQLAAAVLAAQEATQAKSKFLNSMSHDIRTPMNAIIGFTNIAMKQNTDENVGNCLKKINSSSEHLLTLINDVLDISRVESGKAVYMPVPANLCAVTDAVVAITQGFMSNRNLAFRVERPQSEGHCTVLTDPVRVREVLVNILSNAVKFTEDGGTIVFSMGKRPGTDEKHVIVWFTISDTGCGMSKQFLPHLFDEFAQEHSGARTQYKGTGLGMAITKRYVDMMGGTIHVESAVGKGSTFTVELPMELTAEESSGKQEILNVDLTGVKILMAEDNDLNAEIATIQLEETGAQITRAVDGKQVVDIFRENPAGTFDIILMDIMMPEKNGYEACRTIRRLPDRPDGATIPILAMTANAFAEDVQASLSAGMNGHLSKPIVMEEVVKMIAGNLRR